MQQWAADEVFVHAPPQVEVRERCSRRKSAPHFSAHSQNDTNQSAIRTLRRTRLTQMDPPVTAATFKLSLPDPFQATNKSPPLAARAGLSVLVSARITLFLIDISNILQQSNVYAVMIARRHCHELLAAGQSDPRHGI